MKAALVICVLAVMGMVLPSVVESCTPAGCAWSCAKVTHGRRCVGVCVMLRGMLRCECRCLEKSKSARAISAS